jgi:hypothetical protein
MKRIKIIHTRMNFHRTPVIFGAYRAHGRVHEGHDVQIEIHSSRSIRNRVCASTGWK